MINMRWIDVVLSLSYLQMVSHLAQEGDGCSAFEIEIQVLPQRGRDAGREVVQDPRGVNDVTQ